ncbi:MAG: DinB family protein, partial [Betaproteobacteria bacterium]|nr:DinB family protein [Betaproteobacteria bacterium]
MNEQYALPASQLLEWVHDARERTLELVSDLTDGQLTVPMMEVVNPFRWELGHVAFFYDVFLLRILGSDAFLLKGAENLYDSFKVDHDDRWGLPLPSREETLAYMGRVLERVAGRLESRDPDSRESYLYLLSVLHEDMHGEAFTYMRQTLEYPQPQIAIACDRSGLEHIGGGPLPGDVEIPGGTFELGAMPDAPFVF